MKKSTLSFLFIVASAAYVIYVHFAGPEEIPVQVSPAEQQGNTTTTLSLPSATTSIPETQSGNTSATASTPTPATAPSSGVTAQQKSTGMYADGTYTGSQADAYYGTVQVQATIQNGKLTNVNFLQYPNDRRTSQAKNNMAMPILKSEAIQAQSANVDVVSGATDTSMAFQQSLGNALAQAKQ